MTGDSRNSFKPMSHKSSSHSALIVPTTTKKESLISQQSLNKLTIFCWNYTHLWDLWQTFLFPDNQLTAPRTTEFLNEWTYKSVCKFKVTKRLLIKIVLIHWKKKTPNKQKPALKLFFRSRVTEIMVLTVFFSSEPQLLNMQELARKQTYPTEAS